MNQLFARGRPIAFLTGFTACCLVVARVCEASQERPRESGAATVGLTEESVGHRATVESAIGIEGVYYVRYRGPALEVKPFEENAPITLRIADVVRDTSTGDGGSLVYELRFIGTRAGMHSLRDYLVRPDGRPFTELGSLAVSVTELLPADHSGDLQTIGKVAPAQPWPYRMLLMAAAAIWVIPIARIIIKRMKGRSAAAKTAVTQPATLADQLRPLVEAAVEGQLSAAGKARLEFLLIGFWYARLDVSGVSIPEALARLRAHPEAGDLLRQLEAWLHQRPGSVDVDVATVLAPYQNVAGITIDQQRQSHKAAVSEAVA